MIFEEALSLLRQGKKIRHPTWEENDYLMGCYIGLRFSENESKFLSIVKMRGKREHPAMFSHPELYGLDGIENFDRYGGKVIKLMKEGKLPQPCTSPELHTYPQLNLFLILKDDWEIYEE